MKLVIMATALIPACFVLACGTKKHEKKVPVQVEIQSSNATINPASKQNTDCTAQSDCNMTEIPVGHLLVMAQESFLNPVFSADGSVQNHEGVCLEKFTAGDADASSLAKLDMSLTNMELKNHQARCFMQVKVAFKKGYALTIRSIEVPLSGQIPIDSQAVFAGSYGFKGKKAVVVQKALESRLSEKPLRLDHTVGDQDIVWSNCSGEATLVVDTGLSLNISAEDGTGDLRIDSQLPYRMEVVLAKCL